MSLVLLLVILLAVKTAIIGGLVWVWIQNRQQQAALTTRLEASEAQYRQVMTVADLSMAVLDEACHVVDWNPALERLYNSPRSDALGQQFFMRYAPSLLYTSPSPR